MYREYKCKVCGMFTDMTHLKKIFIDDETFNIYKDNIQKAIEAQDAAAKAKKKGKGTGENEEDEEGDKKKWKREGRSKTPRKKVYPKPELSLSP